jgi:hypothetical protein
MGLVKDIQEGLKAFGEIAVKPLLAIALCSGFMLFASDSVLKLLSMTSLVGQYRAWLGGAFTLSCAYLLAHGLNSCAVIFIEVLNTRTLTKRRMRWLATLTPDEKNRLVPYIDSDRASVTYPVNDGVVGGLVGKGVLFRSSNVGHAINGFPYNLQPWARDAFLKHPEYLDGAEEVIRSPHDWMAR